MSFQTVEQRKALASLYSRKYTLDSALLCALIEHESSWNPWAIRYEPAFYHHYVAPLNLSFTEAHARAFSWGLCQVMGQVAREMGFAGNLASLCDPDVGVDLGARKLLRCMDAHIGDTDAALLAYNGGGDPGYPQAVKSLMSKYF